MEKVIVLLSILVHFSTANCQSNQIEFTVLIGPYLGQKTPGTIPEIISMPETTEWSSTFSPDGNNILFDARRLAGFGENDNFINFKLPNGKWGNSIDLGKNINTQSSVSRPYIAPDGKYMYFCSDRINNQNDNQKPYTYEDFQKRING